MSFVLNLYCKDTETRSHKSSLFTAGELIFKIISRFHDYQLSKTESTNMDTDSITRRHSFRGHSRATFHASIHSVQHSQRHTVRQHSRQIEPYANTRRSWSKRRWRNDYTGILLWHIYISIQSSDQEAAIENYGIYDRFDESKISAWIKIRFSLVVGFLQEIFY